MRTHATAGPRRVPGRSAARREGESEGAPCTAALRRQLVLAWRPPAGPCGGAAAAFASDAPVFCLAAVPAAASTYFLPKTELLWSTTSKTELFAGASRLQTTHNHPPSLTRVQADTAAAPEYSCVPAASSTVRILAGAAAHSPRSHVAAFWFLKLGRKQPTIMRKPCATRPALCGARAAPLRPVTGLG